jgi:hypothetical protein
MWSSLVITPLFDGEDLPIVVFGVGEESPAGFSPPRAGEGQGLVIVLVFTEFRKSKKKISTEDNNLFCIYAYLDAVWILPVFSFIDESSSNLAKVPHLTSGQIEA